MEACMNAFLLQGKFACNLSTFSATLYFREKMLRSAVINAGDKCQPTVFLYITFIVIDWKSHGSQVTLWRVGMIK
jgi:hypothetical protein